MPSSQTTEQFDLFPNRQKELATSSNAAVKSQQCCKVCQATYLSDREVAGRYGVSRAAIWRWVDTVEGFPKSIKLSRGTTRWRLSELVQFEIQRERCGSKR